MKRAIWLIGILLLTALALAACGGVPVDTQPVSTQPVDTAPSLPSHTLPAETTSWQEYLADVMTPEEGTPSPAYRYLYQLKIEDECFRVMKEGEEQARADLSALEYAKIERPEESGRENVCYDRLRASVYLNLYLPDTIAFRPLERGEWPSSNTWNLYLDFNGGAWGRLYVEPDGTAFFSYNRPYDGSEVKFFFVSEPGAVALPAMHTLDRLLYSTATKTDLCETFPYDREFVYSLAPIAEGGLRFSRGDTVIQTADRERIEAILVYGTGVYSVLDRPEERDAFLTLLFTEEIAMRPMDCEAADKALWRDIYARNGAFYFDADLDGQEGLRIYLSETGHVVLIDTAGHCYVSAAGALPEQKGYDAANSLS